MRNFKKIFALLLCVVLSMGIFTGCEDDVAVTGGGSGSFSTKDIVTEIENNLEKIDSVHMNQRMDMSVTMNGHPMDMSMDMKYDISVKDEIIYADANIDSSGVGMDMQLYVQKKGNMATVYINMFDTWYKESIAVDKLYELGGNYDGVEQILFYVDVIKDVTSEDATYEGKSATLVSGIIDTSSIEELIKNLGISDMVESVSQGAFTAKEYEDLISGISPAYVSMYVDKATGLPLQMEIDMAQMLQSMYKNLSKVSGHEMDITVNNVKATITFENYNAVEVSIPEEALNA